MSSYADSKWVIDGSTLYVSWTTNLGDHGIAVLRKGHPNRQSMRSVLPITTWADFKSYVSRLDTDRYIFRGQSDNSWRLRSSFHRAGRADLRRFMREDIPILHRALSSLTTHFFDLRDPLQNGAFHALVQHHGYPTPLLDWTYSAYVSAFFAYRTARIDSGASVRIFIFDARDWQVDFRQLDTIAPARRHFSLFRPLSTNNLRLIPQQALLTISNVDDIETYIEEREAERQTQYLQIIDLPAGERTAVMRDLATMNITAGSLFPGFDGACEQLREKLFDRREPMHPAQTEDEIVPLSEAMHKSETSRAVPSQHDAIGGADR